MNMIEAGSILDLLVTATLYAVVIGLVSWLAGWLDRDYPHG